MVDLEMVDLEMLHQQKVKKRRMDDRNCCVRCMCCACCLPLWAASILWFIIISIIIVIIVIGAIAGTFVMPTVNMAGVSASPTTGSQISFSGDGFNINFGLIVAVNNPNLLSIDLTDITATVRKSRLLVCVCNLLTLFFYVIIRHITPTNMVEELKLEVDILLNSLFQNIAISTLRFLSRFNTIPT
jgi:hypothetical protein